MEALISVINKLQDVFTTVGTTEIIQLPQIVVVGTQSSGKSSVLESLVGRSFLPRGTGTVTRCPLVLQLIYAPKGDKTFRTAQEGTIDVDEWAKFLHEPEKVYTDFDEVQKEIQAETDKKAGINKGICPEPINLRVYSGKVVNLTVVDLPGIVKVPTGDQPEDIEERIHDLILTYIENPNSLILAVSPANNDIATSESLKIAKEVDPNGHRTLTVVTKLDLMDKGTDAKAVLCGEAGIKINLGIIGVVNRCQWDVCHNKPIDEAINNEAEFLLKTYGLDMARRNGTKYLAKTLNRLLMQHIRNCLPRLKTEVNVKIAEFRRELQSYGDEICNKSQTLLQIITKFASSYNATINGTAKNIGISELCGGARIRFVFFDSFGKALAKFDSMDGLNMFDILTAIRNASGPRATVFVPEIAFELLVKRQIRRLEEPSLYCVELVHAELQRIIQHCGTEMHDAMLRFPKVHDRIVEVVTELLRRRLPTTREMVENLVAIELAYINTKHPDFQMDMETLLQRKVGSNPEKGIKPRQNPVSLQVQAISTNIQETVETVTKPASSWFGNVLVKSSENSPFHEMPGTPYGSGVIPKEPMTNGMDEVHPSGNPGNGKMESMFSSPTKKKYNPLNTTGINVFRGDPLTGASIYQLSDDEKKECRIVANLIRSYFVIVRKSVQDSVPKAIMHFLVNYVQDNLQSELVSHLYKTEEIDDLLSESNHIAQRRRRASDMLTALQKASQIISEIGNIDSYNLGD